MLRSLPKFLLSVLLWLALLIGAIWAFGALWYDFPLAAGRKTTAVIHAVIVLALLVLVRPAGRKAIAVLAAILAVMAWWFTLQPRQDRDWLPDVAELAWAEVNGDIVTLHNVRNCDYRSPTDYTPRWETRTVRLSSLTGIDIAIDHWGSPYMAHPIISFQFSDAPPIAFSIETRKEKGESYSAIGGIYRQFELIYLAADERDVLRLRTNYRKGETVCLYRLTIPPERCRERFLEYIESLNALRQTPRWYNAATTNCTTTVRSQHPASERAPWDWRMLVNGFMDELMHETGLFASDGLPFSELKQRALINPAAQAADQDPDFSKRIRAGRPGFSPAPAP